jgi:hypothetical protein
MITDTTLEERVVHYCSSPNMPRVPLTATTSDVAQLTQRHASSYARLAMPLDHWLTMPRRHPCRAAHASRSGDQCPPPMARVTHARRPPKRSDCRFHTRPPRTPSPSVAGIRRSVRHARHLGAVPGRAPDDGAPGPSQSTTFARRTNSRGGSSGAHLRRDPPSPSVKNAWA